MATSNRTFSSCGAKSTILVGSLLIIACQHQRPPSPASAEVASTHLREYCWWAVLRSARAPDSVTARFARAYKELKLVRVTSGKSGDTAWAHAGPSWISTNRTNASYESGALAYSVGDSTHLRYFVTIAAPPGGWIRQSDSVEESRRDIKFCTEIARAASIGWIAPGNPTGEESLAVWDSNPWAAHLQDSASQR